MAKMSLITSIIKWCNQPQNKFDYTLRDKDFIEIELKKGWVLVVDKRVGTLYNNNGAEMHTERIDEGVFQVIDILGEYDLL